MHARSRAIAVAAALLVAASCGRSGFEPGATAREVIAVAAGAAHSCALLAGGQVQCWGFNGNGELGRGTTESTGEHDPVAAPVDLGGRAIQIAIGQHHSCALLEGGAVRCWGTNGSGQLGYGHRTQIGDTEPPSAAGDVDVGGEVVELAAGEAFTCARLADGAVRCWGDGEHGKLGHGDERAIGDDEPPSAAGDVPLGGPAAQLAVGDHHACAVLVGGALRCWGDGASGKLGHGNIASIGDDELPAAAGDVPVGAPVIEVAAGTQHTCAILAEGRVRCWGSGNDGRLGYGNLAAIGDNEPASAAADVDLGAAALHLTAGPRHTCALLTTGAVRCWGSARQGRLGYGNLSDVGDNEVPRTAGDLDLGGRATGVSAGSAHTCAVVEGRARCWGAAANHRLGHPGATIVVGDDEPPSARPVLALGATAEQLAAGGAHTCARLTGGNVVCWGSNTSGQNGNPTREAIGDDETPAEAGPIALGGTAIDLAAGADHTCARLTGGAVRCWGSGTSGRLGYGNTVSIGNTETPESAGNVAIGAAVTALGLGTNHTCAVTATGAVRCWGSGSRGQLGYANTASIGDNETPATAGDVVVGGAVRQIALGNTRTCALLTAGTVRCWGDNANGVLGYGNFVTIGDDETPATAGDLAIGGKASQLVYGSAHACALLDDRSVRCWGSGSDGQLGYGATNTIGNNETPASAGPVGVGGTVEKLAAGANHTCAILTGGAVQCWGRGAGGRLGYASTSSIGDNELPLSAGTVDLGGAAIDLAAGDFHTCALLADKTVRCWGDDRGTGALGQAIVENLGDDEPPSAGGDVPLE